MADFLQQILMYVYFLIDGVKKQRSEQLKDNNTVNVNKHYGLT